MDDTLKIQEDDFIQLNTEVKKDYYLSLSLKGGIIVYKVFFENSNGEKRCIGAAAQKKKANKIIVDFLNERNFKSYYWRRWNVEDNIERIDVGSHTEFFEIHSI